MRSKRTDRLGRFLVTGLLVGLAACDDAPPPAPASGVDAATAQQLLDRLDLIVAALQAIPRQTSAVAAPGEAVAERTQVSAPANELEARIAALEREVAVLRARSGSSSPQPRTALVLPLQLHAFEQLKTQLESEDQSVRQELRRSVFGLTQQQVLERFGMPTEVDAPAEHLRYWRWSTAERHLCTVTFVDGLATNLER
ncbi:MAG TPA: hypothetical protein VF384_11300 [Planctomycetota bacterium]